MNTRFDASIDDNELMVEQNPELFASHPGYSVERIMQSVKNFATVSEGLRILGAAVLLASMSIFLLQGWNEGNDIRRYLLLLCQTGLLAASGFALSYGLKETKGARIFFGLALISIPANFTILGALLYSVFQWDGALVAYPDFARWRIEDVANIGMTFAGAMLVLIPVTMFCFAIMARRSATTLSLHFLSLNLLLLLPIRSSTTVGMVAFFGTLYALFAAGKLTRKDGALNTPEGKFALTTLFIPTGIVLFRSMYFYQVDSLLVAMLSLTVFLVARQVSLFPGRHPRVAVGLDLLSLPVALVAALALMDALGQVLMPELQAPAFAAAFAIPALDIAGRTGSRLLRAFAGGAVSVLAALSFIFNVSALTSAFTAFLCLLAGAAMGLAGHAFKNRVALFAGCVTAFAGIFFGFSEFVEMIVRSSWIDLAIFGACAIALGSLLDRHGASLKLRLGKWFAGLDSRQHRMGTRQHP